MSFFGFEQTSDLEEEKRKFLERGLEGAQQEEVPEYTWGEASYDDLGNALEERGDDLNEETFGGAGQVGKDFDFSAAALPGDVRVQRVTEEATSLTTPAAHGQAVEPQQPPSAASRTTHSIWDDKSPFSVLPKANAAHRSTDHRSVAFSPFSAQVQESHADQTTSQTPAVRLGGVHQGVRTLEEIEAEMRQAFASQRNQTASPAQLPHLQARGAQVVAQGRATPQLQQQRYGPPDVAPTPPRMHPHAQSPRLHQYQQEQLLLLEQQRQRQLTEIRVEEMRQQQIRLLELQQEQLRAEELERERQREHERELQRQLRTAQQLAQLQQAQQLQQTQYLQHQRQASGRLTPSLVAELQQRRFGLQTPVNSHAAQGQVDGPLQQNIQYLPRDIQMQQRLLAEMAQAEFLSSMQGPASSALYSSGNDVEQERQHQEALQQEAMRKIMEAERMEEKRRRKLEKIRYMSRYNDLMTQSDKDFITRIQVSQLVTQDPYTEDYYAQTYAANVRAQMGVNVPDTVLKFGNAGGVGLGISQVKGGARRQSAMQRMEAQVERIVNNARLREKEKEKSSLSSLQGALGKTAGRSYKAAPRQLLQVDSTSKTPSPTLAHAIAHISKSSIKPEGGVEGAAGTAAPTYIAMRQEPLTRLAALHQLEKIYDIYIDLEQHARNQPSPEDGIEAHTEWDVRHAELIDKIYIAFQVPAPVHTSNPHPFISLLAPIKGKNLLGRVMHHFSQEQSVYLITLLVACFSQLDVVVNSPVLDTLKDSKERRDVEIQTHTFIQNIVEHGVANFTETASFKVATALFELLVENNHIALIAGTRPGIAFLTVLLKRINQLIQLAVESPDIIALDDRNHWKVVFDQFFEQLTPYLLSMFPSVRQANSTGGIPPFEVPDVDIIDHPAWNFLSILAVRCTDAQRGVIVTNIRQRVLDSISSVAKGWSIPNEEVREMRLANVSAFLKAVDIDPAQVSV